MTIQQECVCCGETFETIKDLFDHMREKHSETEVLAALAQEDDNVGASN